MDYAFKDALVVMREGTVRHVMRISIEHLTHLPEACLLATPLIRVIDGQGS